MAKNVGRVHHASRADSHTLDGTLWLMKKKQKKTPEEFDAILILMEFIF